jgi:multiple sugar transport system ATP-binding protein
MADKIVVMHDGIVEQIGAPLELYDRPDNLFVAQFIGSPAMNVFTGAIRSEAGTPRFVTADGLALPLGWAPAASDNLPAIYGVRPEHFTIADDGVAAEVVVVEPTGSETQVVLKAGETEFVAVFRERISARPGETIRVRPDARVTHLFAADGGRRLAA